MSTFTSRLNLELPTPSESMAIGDNILSDNYQKIDAAMGSTVDSGQPSNPWEGQIWSARDTDLTTRFFYDGTWNPMGSDAYQRGFSAYDVDATVRQASGTLINIMTVSWNSKLGRSYWIEWDTFFKWMQPALGTFAYVFRNLTDDVQMHQRNIQWYSGAVLPYGQSYQAGFRYDEVTADREMEIMMQVDATNAPGLDLQINTGQNQSNILVYDWGKQ